MDLGIISTVIFWVSVGIVVYTYLGYPVLVYAVSRLFPKKTTNSPVAPSVTVIVTAYNEEKSIRRKLLNTLQIDYPREKLEVIVASDCSGDGTDEIVREFSGQGVKLIRQAKRLGKTAAQNAAVEAAGGEIILFSDATSMYEPNVLTEILPNFADPTVGCVAGRLIYVDPAESKIGSSARKYWSYETFLKEFESRACSLIGVSGCIYAVRRSAYVKMYNEACSDFLICTVLYRQKLRSIYHPGAVCFEETNDRTDREFKMRVRIISQTFTDLWRNADMLNPLKSGFYAVQLISHKVLRYAVPLFLMLIAVSSAVLANGSVFFAAVFFFQFLFYSLAAFDWILEKRGIRMGILAVPHYFMLANVASAVGFYKFLRGERYAYWEPIRDRESETAL